MLKKTANLCTSPVTEKARERHLQDSIAEFCDKCVERLHACVCSPVNKQCFPCADPQSSVAHAAKAEDTKHNTQTTGEQASFKSSRVARVAGLVLVPSTFTPPASQDSGNGSSSIDTSLMVSSSTSNEPLAPRLAALMMVPHSPPPHISSSSDEESTSRDRGR